MKKLELRWYQSKALTMLYDWFSKNPEGHVCINAPGGSGKSVIIAAIVKDALQNWPETRVLMLVHSKTLIAQNAAKLREIWPNAPMGIYSAGLKRRCITEPITYAGIGSVAKRAQELGHIDLCLIDEAHAISNEEAGQYRKLLKELAAINPNIRYIGLSASPYRLGQGMVTDGDDALFDDIIEPVTIAELLEDGYLAPLRSKHTTLLLNTDGVAKRGGDFVAGALERAVDTSDNNIAAVDEIIRRAEDCKSWMIFCTGISHCDHITQLLVDRGVNAAAVHGGILDTECDRRIEAHKSGEIACLVSVGKLTTGYDNPLIDLIAFLNPTESPGRYLQCAVRGMRPVYAPGYELSTRENRFLAMKMGVKPNGCKVLDFAGNVARHGPITAIEPPSKAKKGEGEARTKGCPNCAEIVSQACRTCPTCGHEWPAPEKVEKPLHLANDDIMGIEPTEMAVTGWAWRKHTSRTSGKEMLSCTFYGGLADPIVTEYLPVLHEGFAGEKARRQVISIALKSGADDLSDDLTEMAKALTASQAPALLKFKRDGKFHRVIERVWNG